MVLTALRVCLFNVGHKTCDLLVFRSIGFGVIACFTLLIGCGDGGSSGEAALPNAQPGHGDGNGSHPTINVTPSHFAFAVTQGDANPVHTVTISNSGNGTLNWTASTTASWLTLSSSSGTASGNTSDTITAAANLSTLAPGSYSASITVLGVGASNSGQTIPVTLDIAQATSTTTSPPPPTSGSTTNVSVSLAWNPQADPRVVGYYVHYGTQSPHSAGSCAYAKSTYYSLMTLANASSPAVTISGLSTGATYYFAVSAYNGSLESLCSNEVSKAA